MTVAVEVTRPQRPLLGGSQWGHGLGVRLGAPPRGGQKGQTGGGPVPTLAAPWAARPVSARPAGVLRRVPSSRDLRRLAELGVLLSRLHLPVGAAAGCQSPAATPKPSQIHPTPTRTHVRLFPKRKGPSISNHSPVPSSGSPRSRFAGPSPARLPALTACKSTGADGFPGQGVAGNQVSPLEVGVEPKMKALGHSTRCGFTGGQPHHWPQHEAPRTCLRHARPPVCLSACLPCPQPPARLSGFKENSCTSQGDGQTPARPGPQPS